MKWLERLLNKRSVLTNNVKTEGQRKWCVERYKNKSWSQFGKDYPDIDMAVNAMIDWQHMFVGEEFRVSQLK